jgi:rRNA maturation RNase YbeY
LAIKVRNLNRRRGISAPFIAKIARRALALAGERDKALDIAFLDDASMRRYNMKYAHSRRATDVLSFDLGECGQILISTDAARRNSAVFGTSLAEEIALYVVHGILHLCGYDDTTRAARARMSGKESAILKRLCARPGFSKVLTRR